MGKINPNRKRILKRELAKGNSAIKSLKKAGYTDSTAHLSTSNACVKICNLEISKDFDKSKLTILLI